MKLFMMFGATGGVTTIGEIIAYGSGTVPSGYLECNGASLERTGTYADLFSAIGTAWGAADSSHFNLPDLRGRFLRGWSNDETTRDPDRTTRVVSNTGGQTGNKVGTLQADKLKDHTHTVMTYSYDGVGHAGTGNTIQELHGSYNVASGSAGGSETRPINAYVMFIIKATL